MPELPEVEFLKNDISRQLSEKPAIERFIFHRKDLREPIPIAQIKKLIGEPILKLDRRSKYLLFSTPKGDLVSHLGMTGTWRVESQKSLETRKHDHIEIWVGNGKKIIYNDPRRFGFFGFALAAQDHPKIKDLGPEPLSEDFSVFYLRSCLGQKKLTIKQALMDPRVVVGVGNIYASEILFAAGVHPQKSSHSLRPDKLQKIIEQTQMILQKSIESGGSSFRNYVHSDGNKGDFQSFHKVYAREGKPCPNCQQLIRRMIQGGRSTFWCSYCQKL